MPERMRAALRALLPPGSFLKRDRGEALFVTDAPRRGPCPDWTAAGFTCVEEKGLARLTPKAQWLEALAARYPEPPDFLCASLKREGGAPDGEVLRLFAMGMKQMDGAPYDPAFERRLRQLAAARLRTHADMGGLYACGILNYLIKEKRL